MRAHGLVTSLPGVGTPGRFRRLRALTDDAFEEARSVSPAPRSTDVVPAFRLFTDAGRLVLAGSVDSSTAGVLETVLADNPFAGDGVQLDVSRLEFLDVAGCRTLGRWVRNPRTGPVTVHGASPLFRRMWHLMGLDDVAPVVFAQRLA